LLDQGVSLELLSNFELISHTLNKKKVGQFQRMKLPIRFSNSFFSSKQLLRRFPIQAALHIVLDGALVGVLIIVAIMSSVALHSQYLWTKSFTKLEMTRDLNLRILESTSILESYLLKNQKLSSSLVPTKAEDLIYVDRPTHKNTRSLYHETLIKRLKERIISLPVKSGY
tara:strand:- start:185 stop:694 length:510 start_codon:yes stop_codon:yes gene_type:complete